MTGRAPVLPGAAVAFAGLGKMGQPMAANLAKAGYRIWPLDVDAAAVDSFRTRSPGSLAEAAECAAAITMLPDGQVVREVLLGEGGLLPRLTPGALVIDMSSSSPVGSRQLAEELRLLGFGFVDAPVSGGVARAVPGTLAVMAGGDPDDIAAARPLLTVLGRSLHETGGTGSAHAMKALNNYVSAAGLLAATEAVIAAQKFGLDPRKVVDVLNASTGMNNSTQNKFVQYILSRKFDSGFSLGLMAKDLRIALEVIESTGSPSLIAHTVVEAVNDAENLLGGQEDHTGVVKHWEKAAGIQLG